MNQKTGYERQIMNTPVLPYVCITMSDTGRDHEHAITARNNQGSQIMNTYKS